MTESVKRNVLLNPGPATTTDSVKYAQVVPDICPRVDEFGFMMENLGVSLTNLVASPENYDAVLFGGSGTAAVESILTSVISKGVIIINNGAYGQRMVDICSRYKIPYFNFESSWVEPIDIKKLSIFVQDTVRENNISHLACIHNETTSGLLNDLLQIGSVARTNQLELIVDAMSSYGAVPINMETMGIHYLAASSNKNVQGMAGIGIVIALNASLNSLSNIESKSFYLDLYSQYTYFKKTRQTRFTPPVQTVYALKQAVDELCKEGVDNRYQRYSEAWEALIAGLKALNLEFYVPLECHSKIITAIKDPQSDRYDFDEMCDYFYKRGYTIYPGKIPGLNTFRISNIGDITRLDIEKFIVLMKDYLRKIDYISF